MNELTVQGAAVITITPEGVVTLNRTALAAAEAELPNEWPSQLGRHLKGLEDKLEHALGRIAAINRMQTSGKDEPWFEGWDAAVEQAKGVVNWELPK